MSHEIEEDDVFEEDLSHPIEFQPDFAQRLTDSLPSPFRAWVNNGPPHQRKLKLFLMISLLIVILLVIFVAIISVTFIVDVFDKGQDVTSPTSTNDTWSSFRLPEWAYPASYQLILTPDLSTFTFSGDLLLDFTITESHNYLLLNSLDLKLESVTMAGHGVRNIEYLVDTEMVKIEFADSLEKGDHSVQIKYKGEIRDDMRGFYRSVYTGNDGKEHWLASTQFEPTDARMAFPCFDEPDKKATFTITIVYKDSENMVAISNMPKANSTKNGETVKVIFQQTPIMSTYLISFLVGEFSSISGNYQDKPVKVWTPVGQEEDGRFALNVTIAVLAYFEEFFNQPYVMPKLDLVAIPDFSAGAMENWGMITFRLTAILFNSASGTAANLQRVATVVSHELAHQWTGDLVTMAWWSNLWLNEGFADFFETESINQIKPDWNMRDQFLFEDQQRAFTTDALSTTHPIVMLNTTTASDISELFDSITYSKGGSILRMLQDYMGEDTFEQGMQQYISKNTYSNTLTDKFLTEIDITDKGLKEKFHNFLYEPGFPLITVSTTDNKQFTFTQSRFFTFQDRNNSINHQTWWIPINYITSDQHQGFTEISSKSANLQLENTVDWIKLNYGQNGFFRVNYPDDLWLKLARDFSNFRSPDRMSLLNDALVLARSGVLSSSVALSVAENLKSEIEYSVWSSALSQLNYIGTMLATESFYGSYQSYINSLLEQIVSIVGWKTLNPESLSTHNQALLRTSILNFAIKYQLRSAVDTAIQIWNSAEQLNTIAPDDRQAVYCAALHFGGADDYWRLFNYLLETENAAEQNRILYSLGCTREFYLLQHTLNSALNDSVVKPQDQSTVIAGVSANPLGRDLAWDFLQANWVTFNTLGFALSKTIRIVTEPFNDEFHLQQVISFFDSHPTEGASITVDQSIETIQANIQWINENSQTLQQWLQTCLQN